MKKRCLFFGLILFFCLLFFRTPSLAQVCPTKPSGLSSFVSSTLWGVMWQNNKYEADSGYAEKTSGASPSTGKCFTSLGEAYLGAYSGYTWVADTKAFYCGCNNVGVKAYNNKSGCPEVVSDEIYVNFGDCPCARADYDGDNYVESADENVFYSAYNVCSNCTPWTCSWLTCGKADLNRDGVINARDEFRMTECYYATFCWCGTRPADDTPAYICEGQYYGQPQCKAKAVSRPQGACVLDPKWGKIDPKNPSSSTNYWKWTYCYPKGQTLVSPTPTPTTSSQKVCEGKYFGQSQCKAKVTPKTGYSCQLNPALGQINPTKLSDSINYWKWSYCKN